MIKIFTPYIYTFFTIAFCSSIYSQKKEHLSLKIKSRNAIENNLIQKTSYKKNHLTKKEITNEVDSVLDKFKKNGFFTIQIDSTKIESNLHLYYISLNQRIKYINIKIDNNDLNYINNYEFKKGNNISLKTKELSKFFTSIQSKIENNGEAFSKIKLINQRIKNDTLFSDLKIQHSLKRSIDSIIINGYTKIPKSLYSNLLSKKKKFNKKSILEISKIIKKTNYIEETKLPKALFSKDSTIVYVYLKKVNSNSFDGLINFASNEKTKKIELKGYLDFNLNNTFNVGEELNLKWNNNGNNKQNLNIRTKVPFLFSSKINIETTFNLYRHDTIFTNNLFTIKSTYPIFNNSELGLLFSNKNSNKLQKQSNKSTQDFNKKEIGLTYRYSNKYDLNLEASFGTRIHENQNTNQFQFKFNISTIYKTSNKTELFIKNTTAILNSVNYFQNELYRIGGMNSIRGFNEQSIFASKFSYINTEFRFFTKNTSFIYTILDIGKTVSTLINQELIGLGLGYSVINKASKIDFTYTIGKQLNQSFSLNTSKFSIKMLTFF